MGAWIAHFIILGIGASGSLILRSAEALQVKDIKSDNALIDVVDEIPVEGDLLVSKSLDGQRVGVVRVQKVIGERALGKLVRGRMEKGAKLEVYGRVAARKSQQSQNTQQASNATAPNPDLPLASAVAPASVETPADQQALNDPYDPNSSSQNSNGASNQQPPPADANTATNTASPTQDPNQPPVDQKQVAKNDAAPEDAAAKNSENGTQKSENSTSPDEEQKSARSTASSEPNKSQTEDDDSLAGDELQDDEDSSRQTAKGTSSKKNEDSDILNAAKKFKLGVLGSFSSYQQVVRMGTPTETVTMAGSSFSVYGFGDLPWGEYFGWRPYLGLDQFYVTGASTNNNCLSSNSCMTSVNFAVLGSLLKFRYPDSKVSPWIGAGGSIVHPIQKSSNAVQTTTINTMALGVVAVGVDWQAAETIMIPLQFEYDFWPSFTGITTSSFAIRTGIAF